MRPEPGELGLSEAKEDMGILWKMVLLRVHVSDAAQKSSKIKVEKMTLYVYLGSH